MFSCLQITKTVHTVVRHNKYPVLFILLELYNISKFFAYVISDILLGVQLIVIWSLNKFGVGWWMLNPVFLHNLVCDTSKLFSRFQIKMLVVRYLGWLLQLLNINGQNICMHRLGYIEDRINNVRVILTWR